MVTVTEAIRRQYVSAKLVPAERVVALPGGVDLGRFHPGVDGAGFRRSLGIAPDVPLVGLVAGLRVMKGHPVAVEVARRLAVRGRRVHMVFIGAGALEAGIRRAIADAGLEDRVSMAGFVADLPAAIAAFDVALYAAFESEGMSRVLFEYLAMGKPVVATRVGVVPEVLEDGRTALLVPAGRAGAAHRGDRAPARGCRPPRAARRGGERARPRAPVGRPGGERPRRAVRAAPHGGRARDAVKISVLCFDLADNAAGRAFLLARLLEPLGEVEIVGPCHGAGIWPPIAGAGIACRSVPGGKLPGFAASLAALARQADGDLLYASKPRLGSAGVGFLARARADGRCCSTWTTGRSASSSAAASGERWAGASTSPIRAACRGRG